MYLFYSFWEMDATFENANPINSGDDAHRDWLKYARYDITISPTNITQG